MGPLGHFAVGLAAKPAAPKVPLWVLLLAAEVLDLLWLGFQAAGLESFGISRVSFHQGLVMSSLSSIPWSHGLFMSVVWSAAAAAIAFLIFRNRRAGGLIGLVVFSHWVLDFIVHPPELPLLFKGSPMLGLGLWTSGPGLIAAGILEIGLFAGGMAMAGAGKRRKGKGEREKPLAVSN